MAYETIAAALTGVPFPIDRQSLIERIGSREVALDGGKNVTMRELLITPVLKITTKRQAL